MRFANPDYLCDRGAMAESEHGKVEEQLKTKARQSSAHSSDWAARAWRGGGSKWSTSQHWTVKGGWTTQDDGSVWYDRDWRDSKGYSRHSWNGSQGSGFSTSKHPKTASGHTMAPTAEESPSPGVLFHNNPKQTHKQTTQTNTNKQPNKQPREQRLGRFTKCSVGTGPKPDYSRPIKREDAEAALLNDLDVLTKGASKEEELTTERELTPPPPRPPVNLISD